MEILILYTFSTLLLYIIAVIIKLPELKFYAFIPAFNTICLVVITSFMISKNVCNLLFEKLE